MKPNKITNEYNIGLIVAENMPAIEINDYYTNLLVEKMMDYAQDNNKTFIQNLSERKGFTAIQLNKEGFDYLKNITKNFSQVEDYMTWGPQKKIEIISLNSFNVEENGVTRDVLAETGEIIHISHPENDLLTQNSFSSEPVYNLESRAIPEAKEIGPRGNNKPGTDTYTQTMKHF